MTKRAKLLKKKKNKNILYHIKNIMFTPPIIYKTHIYFDSYTKEKKKRIITQFFKIELDKEYKLPKIKKEIIKKKKNTKSKYPKVFKDKAKKLLLEARINKGCSECGRKDLLQVHHIDKNTNNNLDQNLQILCFYCHSKRHTHMQYKKPPMWLK